MKNIFQSNLEKIFYTLKHGKKTPVPPKMEAILPNAKKLDIYVITNNLLDENLIVKLLAKWRNKANVWFPAQFKVTLKGTRKWAKEQLLDKKDRILFFLRVEGGKEPFGHIGLYRFDYEKKSCEIDNVIRGENSERSKGGMAVGLQIIIDWTFKYLRIDNLYLKVFSDNARAIKLYERLGFSEVNKISLFKSINNGVVSWVEDNIKKESAGRYFVTMKYGKKA